MLVVSLLLGCGLPDDESKPAADSPVGDSMADTDVADTNPTEDSGDSGLEEVPCEERDYESDVLLREASLEALIDGVSDDCTIEWYIAELDARAVCAGPWFEDTFVSWSPDGETFDISDATPIFTSSAVLDVIIGPDGKYYLFYGEGDLEVGRTVARERQTWFANHGLIGYGAINAAVSDDGVSFERLIDFQVEGLVRGMVVDPDVLQMSDGTYRMYYVATPVGTLVQPGSWDDGVPHDAYYAESEDLVHWRQVGMAVAGPNADPSVWCGSDDYCVMAATGLDWATSEDAGASWTFETRQDPFGFAPEFHPLEDGRLRMFYNSKEQGGALNAIVSEDGGRTFTDEGEFMPGDTVEAISIAPAPADIGGYYLYYHYWHEGYDGDYWGKNPC